MTGWFVDRLAGHGARPALLTARQTITYTELADRVTLAAERLGPSRRLVLLAATNHPEAVVQYLAALAGGHALILVDAGQPESVRRLIGAYDPDLVVAPAIVDDAPWDVEERGGEARHRLHPELALLLSTSGSTGSPKLVRLSRTNLQANAASIASYLSIGPADRAITSLPMAYSYGLSVINSHLHSGASVVLTDRSVIDPGFWELLRSSGATSFAGVPYTFDLLDRVGFADMALPSLRHVTQAGGRLDPDTVRRYAELGRRRGWELFVMYGQTEATARIAYLPPALAPARPESIGMPIPGGSLRLDPVPDGPPDGGELVYRGPNVMLGYAEGPSDLSRGREIHELHTGDFARRGTDGLYEIVGRRSEFLKIAGHRVDPHGIERIVGRLGAASCVVGTDDRLVVFTTPDAPADLAARLRTTTRLPAHAIEVATVDALPRRPNGKVDRGAIRELAASLQRARAARPRGDATAAVRDLYATTLGETVVSEDDTFSGLGGDSLSYVEITLGLEEILGRLPDRWASMPIRQLGALASPPPERPGWAARFGRWRSVEMGVALRAIAILLIVTTHIGMTAAPGGAHVLMAVAGFNFARFRLTAAGRMDRVAAQLRATARIAVPAMAWVALAMLLLGEYELRHLLLVNALVRDEPWGNLWFIELLVYIGLLMAALLAIPAVDRAERRWPFAAAMTVLGIGLLLRFDVLDLAIPYTKPVLWLFALGWAASRAQRPWQRALVLGVAGVSIPGYFDGWERNAAILLGVALLIGVPRVAVPGPLARAAGVLASASLFIYLVHWEVWPLFTGWYGLPSLGASLGAGIALWWIVFRAPRLVDGWRGRVQAWARRSGAPYRSPG